MPLDSGRAWRAAAATGAAGAAGGARAMNVFAEVEKRIVDAIGALVRKGVLDLPCSALVPKGLTVEPPRDPAHGDIATNAAMVLAKPAGMKPRDIAEHLASALASAENIAQAEVAGPGFINMTLEASSWQKVVATILRRRDGYGRSALGRGEKVNVEYVSANPTGPLHVGHGRGAVFGDALASLLAFAGFDVTREYYWNDAGAQIEKLLKSVFLRYREALGEDIGAFPDDLYPGDYLKPHGEYLAKRYGNRLLDYPEPLSFKLIRKYSLPTIKASISRDLVGLGIRHDRRFNESALMAGRDQVLQTIVELHDRNLVYKGRLPPPKGKLPEDWEEREQLLFRATRFGDDVDRPLVKSDGTYTYFASDMAYHRTKFRRGFKHMIDVWGADHGGYVKRVKAAVAALTDGKGDLDVKICQLVNLYRAGEPVKMSKRAGTFVTLRDVVAEVGPDPVRFMMLYRKNDAPLDFDFVKVVEKSRDNPVFYVQYAHARGHSLFRNVAEVFPGMKPEAREVRKADLSLLVDEGEIDLMKRLAAFPRLIEAAAAAHEPHRIAFYLFELASDLHGQWNRGKDRPQLRFIRDDDRILTAARIALVTATVQVLGAGLGVLGVLAPTEMR